MKNKLSTLIVLLLLQVTAFAQFKVIGYVPNWTNMTNFANTFDFTQVTHLNIAFQNPTTSGSLTSGNTVGLIALVNKAHEYNVKVCISVCGGAASEDATQRATWFSLIKPENVDAFVTKINAFVKYYNLDGVDIDLEGPAINADYFTFTKALYKTLHPQNKLVTAAIKHDYGGYNIPDSSFAYMDIINVMAYDATGSWSATPGQHSSMTYAKNSMNYWINTRHIPAQKLVLGVPFYGYAWNSDKTNGGGNWPYKTIVANYPNNANTDVAGNIIYYNGKQTISDKTDLALESYGGIMIWELSNDATGANSLLTVISEKVHAASGNSLPTISLIKTANAVTIDSNSFKISAKASDADSYINKVKFFTDVTEVATISQAPYTYTFKGLPNGTYKIWAKAIDAQNGVGYSDTLILTVNAPIIKDPYLGSPVQLPGTVEAENYDTGGEGIGYHDATKTNEGGMYRTDAVDIESCTAGGFNVGYLSTGEWLEYTVDFTKSGVYSIDLYVATLQSNKTLQVTLDGKKITQTVNIPNTGGWQTWTKITYTTDTISVGTKALRITIDAGEYNIDKLVFNYGLNATDEKIANLNPISLFPNPLDGNILEISSENLNEILIYNNMGEMVFNSDINSGTTTIQPNLNPGSYIVVAKSNKGISRQILIKN